MTTLRNKNKRSEVSRENHEEHSRNKLSQDTKNSTVNEEYIRQVFEEIEGKVTKKLSQDFSRTEIQLLRPLSKFDEFCVNSQFPLQFGAASEASLNSDMENQEHNEDRSQNDLHPEMGTSGSKSPYSVESDPDTVYKSYIRGVSRITGSFFPEKITGVFSLIPLFLYILPNFEFFIFSRSLSFFAKK